MSGNSWLRESFEQEENKALDFFSTTSPPSQFTDLIENVKRFVKVHESLRKIALITSGGTIVPLEKNTVRYLDNFSGGGRGSASAEYFIGLLLSFRFGIFRKFNSCALFSFERTLYIYDS